MKKIINLFNDFIKIKNKIINLSFGESLKYIMKDKNISSKELAIETNLNNTIISRYLNNKRKPDKVNLVKICNALELDPISSVILMFKAKIIFFSDDQDLFLFYLLINLSKFNKNTIKDILNTIKS